VGIVIPDGAGDLGNLSLNFEPSQIAVMVGVNNTITITNNDIKQSHWFVFTSVPAGAMSSQIVNTPKLGPGQSYTITLTVPGLYNFEDAWHPIWLQGSIVVESST
jgi:plastocyanin